MGASVSAQSECPMNQNTPAAASTAQPPSECPMHAQATIPQTWQSECPSNPNAASVKDNR